MAELWLRKLWYCAKGQVLVLETLFFGRRPNSDFSNFIILPKDELWLWELSSNQDLQSQTPELNFFFPWAVEKISFLKHVFITSKSVMMSV